MSATKAVILCIHLQNYRALGEQEEGFIVVPDGVGD